jgi:long-chain-fatty-acid--CoA ligase ACSBG
MKGRYRMLGYLKNETATRETIDKDGYIHSGDLGKIDTFLSITGRIKELIITAGGENIAPVNIEDSLKDICPIISNVMAIGDDKNFISALISFKVDIDVVTGVPSNKLVPECVKFIKDNL